MKRLLRGTMSERELAEQLGLSTRTLLRWRMQGVGPAYVRIGRSVRYSGAAVRAWMARSGSTDTTRDLDSRSS